jgi:DUF971 family protein
MRMRLVPKKYTLRQSQQAMLTWSNSKVYRIQANLLRKRSKSTAPKAINHLGHGANSVLWVVVERFTTRT